MVRVGSSVYFYKRNNIYYYCREVPSDLRHHFNKKKIEVSLRTKSKTKATRSAATISDKLERHWDNLRIERIISNEFGLKNKFKINPEKEIKLKITDTLSLYHKLKGTGKGKLFFEGSNRSIRYLIKSVGHDNLYNLLPTDAANFREFLFARGMTSSSVKRTLSSVRAIINLSIKEYGLDIKNIFKGIFIPDDNKDKKRSTIPNDILIKIQKECVKADDQSRRLIALLSDTGMRLSEACGLLNENINLNCSIPHIELIEHPWRGLKTKSSIRKIPLVGVSLWAAGRIKEQNEKFAFPKYCNPNTCKANSASAALNKWLRIRVPQNCVIHSFRHSLRDRLRAIECPTEIVDQIGGWINKSVGQNYGQGYSLEVTNRWMKLIELK